MPSKYDPETRANAVRLVLEHREDYPSESAAITSDFGPALEQFLGSGAGLSATTITCDGFSPPFRVGCHCAAMSG